MENSRQVAIPQADASASSSAPSLSTHGSASEGQSLRSTPCTSTLCSPMPTGTLSSAAVLPHPALLPSPPETTKTTTTTTTLQAVRSTSSVSDVEGSSAATASMPFLRLPQAVQDEPSIDGDDELPIPLDDAPIQESRDSPTAAPRPSTAALLSDVEVRASTLANVSATTTGSTCRFGHSHSPLARIPVPICPYCSIEDSRRRRSRAQARTGVGRIMELQLAIMPWRHSYPRLLVWDGMSEEFASRERDRAAMVVLNDALRKEYLDVFPGAEGQSGLINIAWEAEQEIMQRRRLFATDVGFGGGYLIEEDDDDGEGLVSKVELMNKRLCIEIRRALPGSYRPDYFTEEA